MRYYLSKLAHDLAGFRALACLHSARVLLAGTLYHLTGYQPDNAVLKREVFQTRWMLRRILSPLGLSISRELPDPPPNPPTPLLLIEKNRPGSVPNN